MFRKMTKVHLHVCVMYNLIASVSKLASLTYKVRLLPKLLYIVLINRHTNKLTSYFGEKYSNTRFELKHALITVICKNLSFEIFTANEASSKQGLKQGTKKDHKGKIQRSVVESNTLKG